MKNAARSVLGFLHVRQPAEFLWRSFRPEGRVVNQQLRLEREQLCSMYRQYVTPGDLCFDVGANIGAHSEAFIALGARVVAVEPQAACLKILRAKFGFDKRVQIVPMGLDEKQGEQEFLISENRLTSSMSREWVDAISERGEKFSKSRWETLTIVPVTTFDRLIEKYGEPAFCKIDVEGFELQVLSGLSKPINALSFEYTAEFVESALKCVERLGRLGCYEFNYSSERSLKLVLPRWIGAAEINKTLSAMRGGHSSGDVYARLLK